jgi:hypothetical protein
LAKKSASTIETLASEIGRLFGTAEVHARNWLGQKKALLDALHVVRDRATDLIEEVGGSVRTVTTKKSRWTDAQRNAARARMKKFWATKKKKK